MSARNAVCRDMTFTTRASYFLFIFIYLHFFIYSKVKEHKHRKTQQVK